MDRILEVVRPNGRKLAELIFHYDADQRGQVYLTGFQPIPSPEGLSAEDTPLAAFPLAIMPFEHELLLSEEAVRKFDGEFVEHYLLPLLPESPGPYQLTYPPELVLQRYVAATSATVFGIVDVRFSFGAKTKALSLTSGTSARSDQQAAADVLTTNLQAIADLFGQQGQPVAPPDIRRLGS